MGKLEELGWGPFFANQHDALTAEERLRLEPARVIEEQKKYYRVATAGGEYWAEPQGKLSFAAASRAELPAVGDWVLVSLAPGGAPGKERAVIERLLARRTKFSRKAAGDANREQIIAANVDVVFVATSLNQDLNLPRLERYLSVVRAASARPVLLLTKADLCSDVPAKMRELSTVAAGVDVLVVSVPRAEGLAAIIDYLAPGQTAAFVGSSGVGKSTLINWLAGHAIQETREVREDDDKGRHTTTYRRLISLAHGLVIDTPGMRELMIWEGDTKDAGAAFTDIEELTPSCRFTNCGHQSEPGCAVKVAVESGAIDRRRFENYLKLTREAAELEKRNRWKKKDPKS